MVGALVLAAGKSTRLIKDINMKKQFLKIGDKPIFMCCIEKFLDVKKIDNIILVIDEADKDDDNIKCFLDSDTYKNNKSKIFITYGGENRYDSVRNSFLYIDEKLGYSDKDKILIHDGARPFIESADIEKVIDALDKVDNVSLAGKIVNTIKKIEKSEGCDRSTGNSDNDGLVKIISTEDRNNYLEVYTPQGFRYGMIKEAYEKMYNDSYDNRLKITDDLQVVEKYLAKDTFLLESNRHNIKITTKEDLIYL